MPVIAIDGPAAAGKGTLARRLAAHFGFAALDTGLLYRAVGARLIDAGIDPEDRVEAIRAARTLDPAELHRPGLRREAVGRAASIVAAITEVRAALLAFQHRFAAEPPGGARGALLEGRDIGTVICPGAEVKLFVTATPEERARRRHLELLGRGEASIYADVLADVLERDKRDSGRETAPLRPAEDAVILDTTDLDAEAAFAKAMAIVSERLSGKGSEAIGP